ncbi:hypothetical protein [Candidatus Palauibacter sp.]|uniref:hypothetical protein n=1 Tax=Candidatus Palauibacter sp. TaxID=3101350 RepID=UPI003C6F8837
MAKVLEGILESFYATLSESGAVSEAMIKELRTLFASEKRLKADDFAAIFENAAKDGSLDSD